MSSRPIGACGLCHEVHPLCRSHLLPRAFYRLLRSEYLPNPNPHFLADSLERNVPHQVKDYLLCEQCEQMFRKNGEDWITQHCYRGNGVFRLLSYLEASTPVKTVTHMFAYDATLIRDVDIDCLTYFAASVVWRGAARNWHLGRRIFMATTLGKRYRELFRLYLLGLAPFPYDAVLVVIVSRKPNPILAVQFPEVSRQDESHHHWFHIPGIAFHLFVGRAVPASLRRLCLVHSPFHMIYSSDALDDKVLGSMSAQLRE